MRATMIARMLRDAQIWRVAACLALGLTLALAGCGLDDVNVPALDGPCLHSATCMYSNTPDEHFVIARHPDSENITVACGFSGHGFKFVPIVGEILADLAIDGVTGHPISLFDPKRLVTT